MASAGDVNGDGYADVIVGAPSYDAGRSTKARPSCSSARASGIADGSPATAHAQLESDQVNASMGTSVASAGDVNGDGYADVIVGADRYDAGQTDEGAAFVFLGSAAGIADGTPATAHAQLESNQASALGGSVASAGDVNGDGYADVIVGANGYDAGQNDEGAAFVFLGSASGIADGTPATAHAQLESDQSQRVAGPQRRVGRRRQRRRLRRRDRRRARLRRGADRRRGRLRVPRLRRRHRRRQPGDGPCAARVRSGQAQLGASVASAGDVNGDGFADVIVGAADTTPGRANEGAAFVFLGSRRRHRRRQPRHGARTARVRIKPMRKLGRSVASAGDVNGDGFADVIVGAPLYDSRPDRQRSRLRVPRHRRPASPMAIPRGPRAARVRSSQRTARPQRRLGGDVNGDGFADVIVGAHLYDAGETDEGAAFVFLGNSSEGRPSSRASAASRARGASWHRGAAPDTSRRSGSSCAAATRRASGACARRWRRAPPVSRSATWLQRRAEPGMGAARRRHRRRAAHHHVTGVDSADALPLARARAPRRRHRPLPANPAHGPWRRLGAQAVEGDIRTVPEPGVLAGLASGIALLWRCAAPSARPSARRDFPSDANRAAGSGRVRGEIEACPASVAFGGGSCTSVLTPSWIVVNATTLDASLSQTVAGLGADGGGDIRLPEPGSRSCLRAAAHSWVCSLPRSSTVKSVLEAALPHGATRPSSLSNYWGQSFDYVRHRTHLNARSARVRADGSVQLVVAHRDPAVSDANWLDTAGHDAGVWQFRWLAADGVRRDPEAARRRCEELR